MSGNGGREVIAGLGWRALAAVVDLLPSLLIGLGLWLVLRQASGTTALVASIAASLLAAAWAIFVWWGYATRGQGPGARVAKIQVLNVDDGRPVGWGRYFLRQLIWFATASTTVIWVIMLVLMVVHPHRRGWHDLAAKAVVVRQRPRATPEAEPRKRVSVTSPNVVPLPPHLRTGFAAQAPAPVVERPAGPISSVPTAEATTPQPPLTSGWAPPPQPAAGPTVPWEEWGAGAPSVQPARPVQQVPLTGPAGQPRAPQGPGQGGSPQGGAAGMPTGPGQAGAQQGAGRPGGPQAGPYPPAGQPSAPTGPVVTQVPGGSSGAAAYAQSGTGPEPDAPLGGVPRQSYEQDAGQGSGRSPASYAPVAAPPTTEPEDDGFHTHLAPATLTSGIQRSATEGWQLRLDDGRVVDVDGLVLIGRKPSGREGEQAQLVEAGQGSRMVSKTHLAVGLDHRGVYVMDRNSTNGTAIANANGEYEPCAPGDPVRVREGQVVSFGDHYLEVRRRAPEPR